MNGILEFSPNSAYDDGEYDSEPWSYGKFFVDTMLTPKEVLDVWHEAGFYKWG